MSDKEDNERQGELVDGIDELTGVPDEVILKAVKQRKISITVASSFSGPLPPPKYLQQYDKITPGFAERLMRMAEKEQGHRHATESKALEAGINAEKVGQKNAYHICMILIFSSVLLIGLGHDLAGGLLGGTTILGLAYVFINGKRKLPTETEDDQQE